LNLQVHADGSASTPGRILGLCLRGHHDKENRDKRCSREEQVQVADAAIPNGLHYLTMLGTGQVKLISCCTMRAFLTNVKLRSTLLRPA
jgi:hypothetical protein